MAQIYLDDEEYEAVVTFFMDNFEVDLTQARIYADNLLSELDFGRMVEDEPKEVEKEEKVGEQGSPSVGL